MSNTVWVITEIVAHEGGSVEAVVPDKQRAVPKIGELSDEHRYNDWKTITDHESAYSYQSKDVVLMAKEHEVEE